MCSQHLQTMLHTAPIPHCTPTHIPHAAPLSKPLCCAACCACAAKIALVSAFRVPSFRLLLKLTCCVIPQLATTATLFKSSSTVPHCRAQHIEPVKTSPSPLPYPSSPKTHTPIAKPVSWCTPTSQCRRHHAGRALHSHPSFNTCVLHTSTHIHAAATDHSTLSQQQQQQSRDTMHLAHFAVSLKSRQGGEREAFQLIKNAGCRMKTGWPPACRTCRLLSSHLHPHQHKGHKSKASPKPPSSPTQPHMQLPAK